jgi:IclR family pca regulon transcriptional regulator
VGLLDGDEVVFLYRHEARRFLKYDLKAGSRLPSHCTATGKVLLAALPDDRLKPMLSRMNMEAMTRYTITTPKVLWDHLIKTRRRGHSVSDREMSLALYSVGVPVLNEEQRVVAAVNVSLAADASQPERAKALAELIALGSTLSQAMGYEGAYPLIPAAGAGGSGS